ncbi:DUF397 domain-containing protein [Streptomyces capitiformicae]|uniref:DUF397 domain-containing protein n=1 Tax=Streptomyces capitiformicae TaxID=2014920 RepID=A0A918YXM6_9ACTN|nr:DUF397 domain-containing protein [Streptomyces capitiformicae]GHE27834.1 hypothetical protein GCM10017771_42730 [Streptomyces capitiformicae]
MPADLQLGPEPAWFKSSHSGGNTTECVEAAFVQDSTVVRDSKDRFSPCLSLSHKAWADFIAALQAAKL